MAGIAKMYEALMTALGKNKPAGLGVKVILGYPDTARSTPALPLGAITFEEDDYKKAQHGRTMRLGQTQPAGNENQAFLYFYATGELQLLNMIDDLRGIKAALSSISVGQNDYALQWGATQRVPYAGEERMLAYVAVTPVVITWFE